MLPLYDYEMCMHSVVITSPDCKMTYQCATILNQFHMGALGKLDASRAYKQELTLVYYFHTWVKLMVYYYWVIYKEDGHFERTTESWWLPKEAIQLTPLQ